MMKIRELIEELKGLNPEADVRMRCVLYGDLDEHGDAKDLGHFVAEVEEVLIPSHEINHSIFNVIEAEEEALKNIHEVSLFSTNAEFFEIED
jgi:hypothetical protein